MRLLVVSHYFWPENFRINDMATELVRRGHEVTVLTGIPNYPDGRVYSSFRERPHDFARLKGVRIVRVPMFARGNGRLGLLLNYLSYPLTAATVGAWRLRGQPFDMVFIYQMSPATVGFPGVVMRWLKQAPLTIWILDLWPDTLQAMGILRSRWSLGLASRLMSAVYNRCGRILAQSRSFMPMLTARVSDPGKVVYYPSWAESVFTGEAVAAAPEVPMAPECFSIMFAGNIGDAQDFPAILAAAEHLKGNAGVRWLIVGDGSKAAWVAEQIRVRGLERSVLMLGKFPVERMPALYAHADALLVSLKNEAIFAMTIPGKLQSYLAAGIPVLAMLNGEGGEIVREGGAGLSCAAGDSIGLAAAVLQLAALSPEQRAAMGRNGRRLTDTEYSRDVLVGRFEQLCADMMREHQAVGKGA